MRTATVGRLLGTILLIVGLAGVVFVVKQRMTPAVNPDPNHTHADFAVWVNGTKLDFSKPQFMSGTSDPKDPHHEDHHKFLHLHDGLGNVIHRHKPGLTLGEFFLSLGTTIDKPDGQALCVTFPQADRQCDAGDRSWQMVINHAAPVAFDPGYVFNDGDKILILYPAADTPLADQIATAWSQMTDDACRYSRTCPWRGNPPAEHCIADPTVPCVVE